MKKIKIISSIMLLATAFVSVGISSFKQSYNTHAEEFTCTHHHGNHYLAKDPTNEESGWKEFWVCCECHHVYLNSAPEGEWTTRDASEMVGGLSEEHPAYLPPIVQGSDGDCYIEDLF